MDMGMLLVGLVIGLAIAFVYRSFQGKRLIVTRGRFVNTLLYVAGAIFLAALGVPLLYAYLWPVPVIAVVWLVRRREQRVE